jgi:hypothetical protein
VYLYTELQKQKLLKDIININNPTGLNFFFIMSLLDELKKLRVDVYSGISLEEIDKRLKKICDNIDKQGICYKKINKNPK